MAFLKEVCLIARGRLQVSKTMPSPVSSLWLAFVVQDMSLQLPAPATMPSLCHHGL